MSETFSSHSIAMLENAEVVPDTTSSNTSESPCLPTMVIKQQGYAVEEFFQQIDTSAMSDVDIQNLCEMFYSDETGIGDVTFDSGSSSDVKKADVTLDDIGRAEVDEMERRLPVIPLCVQGEQLDNAWMLEADQRWSTPLQQLCQSETAALTSQDSVDIDKYLLQSATCQKLAAVTRAAGGVGGMLQYTPGGPVSSPCDQTVPRRDSFQSNTSSRRVTLDSDCYSTLPLPIKSEPFQSFHPDSTTTTSDVMFTSSYLLPASVVNDPDLLVFSSATDCTQLESLPGSTAAVMTGTKRTGRQAFSALDPTDPMLAKRLRRQDQNRRAASKCRIKRRTEYDNLKKNQDIVLRDNEQLKAQLCDLKQRFDQLNRELLTHQLHCNLHFTFS